LPAGSFESTRTQEGGELCWPIVQSFWRHPQEQFGQSVCSKLEPK